MATVAIQDVLGAPQMLRLVEGIKTGIPDKLPPGFFPKDKTVEKDYGSYTRVTGSRRIARLAKYGAPAQRRQLRNVEDVPVKLIHSIESIEITAADFRGLIKKDSTGSNLLIDEKGADEIARQVRQARVGIDNLKIAARTQAIVNGAIYFDGQGNLLPNSSGAVTTPTFGIPAGNQGQLNVFGTGNILTAGWENASTDIATQVMTVKQQALRLSGYPIKYAFYGINVPKYLTTNNTLEQYFIRNGNANTQFIGTGDIPNPLLGLTWVPLYDDFFEDNNGVNQNLVGPDTVVFTPEPSLDWHGELWGKYDVPRELIGSSGMDLLGSMTTVEGDFIYATIVPNPVRIEIFYGTTFLPTICAPLSVMQATVNF